MTSSSGNLVSLRITTKLGAEYVLPDLEQSVLEGMCTFRQDGVPTGFSGQLCLTNASVALLNVPFRIIKKMEIKRPDGEWEEWWDAPEREDECFPA